MTQVLTAGCNGVNAESQMEEVGHSGYSNRAGRLEAVTVTAAVSHGPVQPAEHRHGHHQNALRDFHGGVCLW